jgi:putative ABC transport system permease protein
MRWLHDVIGAWHRLIALFGRRRRERDIENELAFHLAMRQAEHERAGVRSDRARLAAMKQFGNVTSLKEQTSDMWTFPSFESLMQDARYAIRSLWRAPGFSLVAVLVLALGIGANTAMFSLVDAAWLRGLPFRDSSRLVVLIGNVQRANGVERRGNSLPDHLDWRAKATRFDDIAAYNTFTTTLLDGDEPERLTLETVSAPYFSLLGVAAAQGRTFREEEDAVPSRDFVVVLSDGLWRRRFGADPAILNRTIRLSGASYTVIGVMPPGFTGITDTAQAWVPFALSGFGPTNRGGRGFQTLARLKSGVTMEQAQAEMNVISAQLAAAFPATNDKRGVEVTTLSALTFGSLQTVVVTLMAAVSFVLLIACTNVANLLISRSDARQTEIAVRTALGAGPSRLFRLLATESCLLTLAGAASGLGVAYAVVTGLPAISPIQFPTFVQPALNGSVLGFTVVVAMLSGLLLGLAPAMHARVSRLTDALKESTRGGSSGVRSQRLRAALVVAEVALAIVLFIGAGLMIRSGQKLAAIDPGFDPANLLVVNVSLQRQAAAAAASALPGQPAPPPPPLVLSGRELLDRVSTIPGVMSAALASDAPLTGNSSAVFYSAEGDTTTDAQTAPRAYVHRVSPAFFETLRLPITGGRTFDDADATPPSSAVIVSDNVARRFWPNQDPIGKRIVVGAPGPNNPWLTIVGTVGESKYRALPVNPTADPDLYFPALNRPLQPILIRTAVEPTSIIPAIRAALRRDQPTVVVFGETTMAALVSAQSSASQFTTWILGLFATVALVLSVIGIYGVMSYLVTQRTREFGIRLALGATRSNVVASVLRLGTVLIIVGAAIGVAITAGLYRLFSTMLFQVTAFDRASGLAVLALVGAALLACVVPAIRATRVDPVVALRN